MALFTRFMQVCWSTKHEIVLLFMHWYTLFILCINAMSVHGRPDSASGRRIIWHLIKSTLFIQGDQKVSVHPMITIQKVTSYVQCVPRHSQDMYWHAELCSRRLCSVQHGPHSECVLWWPSSNHQLRGDCSNTLSRVHRDFLITLYFSVQSTAGKLCKDCCPNCG